MSKSATPTRAELDAWRSWATVRQLEYIEAVEKHGSVSRAAAEMGVSRSTLRNSLEALRGKAELKMISPEHGLTTRLPEIYSADRITVQVGPDGMERHWLKGKVDAEKREAILRAAIEAMVSDISPPGPLVPAPDRVMEDLLTVYPMGDPHFGMYAWAKEAGEDFDLKIARRITLAAVDRLVQSAPPSETAILLPLGDVFHMNDQTNQTPAHKHQLDADSRFVHVLEVAIETFRHAILRCLEKHAQVVVRFVKGNHDPEAVWALAFATKAFFSNEPRVSVDVSPAEHWFYRFGSVLLGATHGDKAKPEALMGVMACDRARDWGETRHRYWYCGHVHHSSVKELPGVTVETFRTLAAADAYARGHGYRAGRDMRAIVLHRDAGEIERHRCDVGQIETLAA